MTTATAGSEVAVAAPQLQEPVTGILAQVPVIGPASERWLAGMTFPPEVAGQPEFRDLCLPTVLGGSNNRIGTRTVNPFDVVLNERCSSFGFPESDYEGRVTRALAAKRSWAVEREFEKGELISSNLHLAATYTSPNPTTTVSLASGANVSPADAMALLDEAIGNATNVIGRGMIWCTPFVGAKWKEAGALNYEMIDSDAGVGRRALILSPAGNHVVICGGMEGRGPDGNVVGSHASQWAYATDPVVVVRGVPKTLPGSFLEALDSATDTVTYRQEQWFSIQWAGLLHAGVKVATATPTVT